MRDTEMSQTKMYKIFWNSICFLLLIFLCQACAKSSLVDSWTTDSFVGPVKGPILVIGAFRDPVAHKIFEDSFVASLENAGVSAIPSYQFGLGTTPSKKNELQQVVKKSGASAFLITHLLSEKTSTEAFLTAHQRLATIMYWDSGHNYHSIVYDRVWAGDVVTRKVERMEASLFEAESGKHLWSVRTKTVNFENLLRDDDDQLEHLFIKNLQRHKLL
jgi:hypothetical protein